MISSLTWVCGAISFHGTGSGTAMGTVTAAEWLRFWKKVGSRSELFEDSG